LRWSLQAPVRFLRFPGEPHHPGKYVHQFRKVQEEPDWLENTFFRDFGSGGYDGNGALNDKVFS